MRELKFRAWLKENKKMVNVLAFNSGCKGVLGNTIDASIAVDKKYPDYDVYKMDKVELMQYTGLKDLEGNEIFESDLLMVPCIGGKTLKEVKYFDGCFWLVNKGGKSPLHFYTLLPDRNYEKIGNIYENPEGKKFTHGWDVYSDSPLTKKEIDVFKKSILKDIEKEKSSG